MSNKFKILDADFLHKDTVVSFSTSIFKVGELALFSSYIFRNIGLQELNNKLKGWGRGQIPLIKDSHEWIENGKECEILVPGAKGWQKGRLRIKVVLEFCPDEVELEETPEKIIHEPITKNNHLMIFGKR
ncbi:KGK domain-containing protein [Chroococcidiopsis sp. TS-821]|uniref:KGK domain-containing protein n=1 Tax=Chroococcidiopsis sp. TS-821 TaxID=1378066 RepID=UPI000CEF408F|nr:KGK domain-containing protein [Chroococcidiopsis sp. TS-821]PPS45761.1 hypothetical protein B1A85_05835 [Chroococcidiopsis sp. TS-821]